MSKRNNFKNEWLLTRLDMSEEEKWENTEQKIVLWVLETVKVAYFPLSDMGKALILFFSTYKYAPFLTLLNFSQVDLWTVWPFDLRGTSVLSKGSALGYKSYISQCEDYLVITALILSETIHLIKTGPNVSSVDPDQ